MDVWRTEIRVIHGADTNKPDGMTGLRIVAPNRDPAGRAAGDLLTLAARRGRHDNFRPTSGVHDTIGLIERIERPRGPGLAHGSGRRGQSMPFRGVAVRRVGSKPTHGAAKN